jgi:hypothetical protein
LKGFQNFKKIVKNLGKIQKLVETQFEMSKFRKIAKKRKLQKFGGNPI